MSDLHSVKEKIIQFKWRIWDFWRTYILRQQDCDNCRYFGGCCCDHIDENGNCLGWERIKFDPFNRIKMTIYLHKVKKLMKQINKELKELD